MPAEIIVNDKAVIRMLNELGKRAKSLRPVMSEIGEIILSSVEKNFEAGGRYSTPGSFMGGPRKWDPLASATIRQRKRKGKWPGQILVMTAGGLAASISKSVRNDQVAVGTNKKYGAIHQFGGAIDIAARSETFQRKRSAIEELPIKQGLKLYSGLDPESTLRQAQGDIVVMVSMSNHGFPLTGNRVQSRPFSF